MLDRRGGCLPQSWRWCRQKMCLISGTMNSSQRNGEVPRGCMSPDIGDESRRTSSRQTRFAAWNRLAEKSQKAAEAGD